MAPGPPALFFVFVDCRAQRPLLEESGVLSPDQMKPATSNAQRARKIVGWLAIPLTGLMLYSTVNETVKVLDYEVPVGVVMLIMWLLGVLAIWGRIPTTQKA